MGDGNATLFDRFFAKIDKKNNQILEDGTMTMLIHMVQHNYLKLLYTNNIGAKYAYTLSDEELKQAILKFPHEDTKQQLLTLFASDSTLLRAKLAIPRFFPQEANMYIALIGDIFQARMLTNK